MVLLGLSCASCLSLRLVVEVSVALSFVVSVVLWLIWIPFDFGFWDSQNVGGRVFLGRVSHSVSKVEIDRYNPTNLLSTCFFVINCGFGDTLLRGKRFLIGYLWVVFLTFIAFTYNCLYFTLSCLKSALLRTEYLLV